MSRIRCGKLFSNRQLLALVSFCVSGSLLMPLTAVAATGMSESGTGSTVFIMKRSENESSLAAVLDKSAGSNAAEVAGASGAAGAQADLSITLDTANARHLLARTGIGVSPAELQRLTGLSRGQAIDAILDGMQKKPAVPMPDWVLAPIPHYHGREDMDDNERAIFDNARDAELAQLRQWWILNMLQTPSPQSERLVLFWHDLFATSYYDTDSLSVAMARQNQTFREKGLGSWHDLLSAMIRDPALLQALDAPSNHKDSPNENLARTLLHSFTLGEGNSDETLVREAARSLTGLDFSYIHNLEFRMNTWDQDRGEKTLFGVTGNFTGDDLIDRLLEQPAAAEFLAARFWSAFISDKSPDSHWLAAVSNAFRQSSYDIATLYRVMLQSNSFWDPLNRGVLVKTPVDLLIGTARSLEFPKRQWRSFARWQETLGMELFAPQRVSSKQTGAALLTPDRLLLRHETIDSLLTASTTDRAAGITDNAQAIGELESGSDDELFGSGVVEMLPALPEESWSDTSSEVAPNTNQARLRVRVAAENYLEPVQYRVSLFDQEKRLWTAEPTSIENGQDTERDGRIADRSELTWSMNNVSAPAELLNIADRVEVEIVNAVETAEGSRNLYLDGVQIDDRWLSSSRAVQESECPPTLAANSGNLLCTGKVIFDLSPRWSSAIDDLPAWRASAVHVQWADQDIQDGWIVAEITLDDVVTPDKRFHTLQMQLEANAGEPTLLTLNSFGCWPDCVSGWPECAWQDEHFPANRELAFANISTDDPFWSSDAAEVCHYNTLGAEDKQLVGMLWNNAASILEAARQTPAAVQFADVLDRLSRKVNADAPPPDTAPHEAVTLHIDPRYAPEDSMRADLQADEPAVGNLSQSTEKLQSNGISITRLLMPDGVMTGKSELIPDTPATGFDEQALQDLTRQALFQFK